LDVEHAMPRDHEIVDLAAVAHVVRACDGSHVLLFKGQIALYPGDALLVAGTGARLVARATRCLIVNLPCWHYVPPVGATFCGRPVLCVAGKEYTRLGEVPQACAGGFDASTLLRRV